MNTHKLTEVRPGEGVPKQTRAVEQHISDRQPPLSDLHGMIANRALQRLLVQREAAQGEELSLEEKAECYLRQRLADNDRYIMGDLSAIERNLGPDEQHKVPVVQGVKSAFRAMGVMTPSMVEPLQRAIQQVKFAADYIDDIFYQLRRDVRYRDELIEGFDDPEEWYMNETRKWFRR